MISSNSGRPLFCYFHPPSEIQGCPLPVYTGVYRARANSDKTSGNMNTPSPCSSWCQDTLTVSFSHRVLHLVVRLRVSFSAALGVLRMNHARSNHDTGYGELLACSADHFEKQDD